MHDVEDISEEDFTKHKAKILALMDSLKPKNCAGHAAFGQDQIAVY